MTSQSYTLMNLVTDMHDAFLAWYGDEEKAVLATRATIVELFGNPVRVDPDQQRVAMRLMHAA